MRLSILSLAFALVPATASFAYLAGRTTYREDPPPKASNDKYFHLAQEFRVAPKPDAPLPSATENHVIYTVPAGRTLRLQSFSLPLGLSAKAKSDGAERTPLGLGLLVDSWTIQPLTVRFNNSPWELVRLDPGVVLEGGSRLCLRFDEPIKALSGSLFLNGTWER